MALILINACKKDIIEVPITPELKPFRLIWNVSDIESKQELEIGLKWYFSILGATLPIDSWTKGVEWHNETHFSINYKELGFNSRAIEKLNQLADLYRSTGEFKATDGIDVGRFVANTLNNSNHYYQIVGMPSSYTDFLEGNKMASYHGAINPSSVSFGYRKILFPDFTNLKMTFVSEEFLNDFTVSQIEPVEFETIDVMPNGQLRYGIYENGNLISGANPVFSAGGKPSKCMWCHESVFLPNFSSTKPFSGYVSGQAFNDTMAYHNKELTELRAELNSMFDYSKRKEHTQMELIYIRFYEPSATRLANEWGISIDDVKSRLASLKTHIHHEFPELGDLYYRDEVDPFAPFSSLSSPKKMRETEDGQPELLI